jgi:hypothetical protein
MEQLALAWEVAEVAAVVVVAGLVAEDVAVVVEATCM